MFKELNNLKLFFEEPTREFHLRELARLLKKNPTTVKNYLRNFIIKGILKCKKERGLELYATNTQNFYYKEYKKIYNNFKLIDSGLLEYLNRELNLPTIIVFGSYSRGEDGINSDLDIFVLTELKKEIDLRVYEKKINRSIQLHIMNKKEFNENKKNNPDLINSIINGNILNGFMEIL